MAQEDDKDSNLSLFRECFSSALLERLSRPRQKHPKKRAGRDKSDKGGGGGGGGGLSDELGTTSQEELSEFIEFLASEIFPSLPPSLQNLSHKTLESDPEEAERWTSLTQGDVDDLILPTLPGSVAESVSTYSLLPESTSLPALLLAAIDAYAATLTAPPPVWTATKTSDCEICGRDWIPLTYHHLIPRSVHAKVLKRGWHEERELNRVAWLCRACHSFVHRCASNEELARELYSVELLTERRDVQDWAKWVSTVRWKAR